EASGPSYSVPSLCDALARHGDDVRLFTISDNIISVARYRHEQFVHDWKTIPILAKVRASRGLYAALDRSVADLNVFHSHGLWLMANIYPALVQQRTKLRLVVSPRGMLGTGALKFSRYSKLEFWHTRHPSALLSATCFHA